MSDEMNTMSNAQSHAGAIPAKKPGLFSTPSGRIVAIVVGLGVLGIVVGIAIAIVFHVVSPDTPDGDSTVSKPPATSAGSTATTATVQVKTPAARVSNSELFTFRDIFEPLLKPVATSTSTTTGDTSTSTTPTDTITPTSSNTLYLDGVVAENGVLKAQLRFNGSAYVLGPGAAIPNSPWQVLRVSTSIVTMLYGDTQVTLAVGQGITK